jgi:hypothetical protein
MSDVTALGRTIAHAIHGGASAAAAEAIPAGCPYARALAQVGGDASRVDVHELAAAAAAHLDERPQAALGADGLTTSERTAFHGPGDATLLDRIAEDPQGQALGTRRALGAALAPLCEDLLAEVRALRDVPLEDVPLAGTRPVAHAYAEPLEQRRAEFARFVPAADDDLTVVDHAMQSHQAPEPGWVRGMDLWVPVGDHGEAMARALVDAGRAMDAILLGPLRGSADELTRQYAGTLANHTFRGDALHSMLEAVGTFAGTTGVLTQHAVEGMDGSQLLRAIADDKLLVRIANGPIAVAGPMTFEGFAPTESVAVNARGRLALAAPFGRILDATKAQRSADAAVADATTGTHLIQTRRGCPVNAPRIETLGADGELHAAGASYIQQLGEEYLGLAQRFYAAELARGASSVATAA